MEFLFLRVIANTVSQPSIHLNWGKLLDAHFLLPTIGVEVEKSINHEKLHCRVKCKRTIELMLCTITSVSWQRTDKIFFDLVGTPHTPDLHLLLLIDSTMLRIRTRT